MPTNAGCGIEPLLTVRVGWDRAEKDVEGAASPCGELFGWHEAVAQLVGRVGWLIAAREGGRGEESWGKEVRGGYMTEFWGVEEGYCPRAVRTLGSS